MKGSLPITIGITGHRDIRHEDIPAIESSVEQTLRSYCERYPSSPIYVISALAEGADRLVAKTALRLGMQLIAPLPLPKELYKKDFTSAESLQEFDELLSSALEVFEMPILLGSTYEDISVYGSARDKQYALVGAYITRYSHFVLALWDGDLEEKVGGSSYVVGFKLRGIPPPYVKSQGRFEPEETGAVIQIVTPRISHPQPMQRAGTVIIHYPEASYEQEDPEAKFRGLMRDTDGFNIDEVTLMDRLSNDRSMSKQWLSPPLPDDISTNRSAELSEHFASADTLSIYYQKKTLVNFRILFSAAMLATMAFEFYAYILIDEPGVLLFLFGVLIAAYSIFYRASKHRYQDKFQDYRTLAEGLRVQYYWEIAGIEESVANNYLKDQRSELDWIRHGLRSWTLPLYKRQINEETSIHSRFDIILNGWVIDQFKYFAKASVREMKRLKRFNRFANFFLIGGFSLIGADVIYHYFIGFSQHAWILFLASIMPIAAGLLFGYAEKRSLAEHARKYEKMAALFAKAKKQIEDALEQKNTDEALTIVYDLGLEALKENGDWVLTHRNRPIEVPLA
jgi:hypothetical protein